MTFFVTTPFSMEKPVKIELEKMGIQPGIVSEGRVYFDGSWRECAVACVNLRSGDRVFLQLASFTARSFDELFDNVSLIKWNDIISKNGRINIGAKCARSQLMSVPDVQKITKTAVIKALQRKYHIERLPENGEEYPIEVHINRDNVTVALDCCGTSLHKRGYRIKNAVAPLRETFASGLLDIAGYRGNTPFCDPFCGSGTLAIEAAMRAQSIAPGMNRTFAAEKFIDVQASIFEQARRNARDSVKSEPIEIYASDISKEMTDMTRYHAERAGVGKYIRVTTCAAGNNIPPSASGIMVTNPPYGERIGDKHYMVELCGEIKNLLHNYGAWSCNILSGYKSLERDVGERAQKIRRFYNGNIECNFYSFPKK